MVETKNRAKTEGILNLDLSGRLTVTVLHDNNNINFIR